MFESVINVFYVSVRMADLIKRKEELQKTEIELEVQDNIRVVEEMKAIEENERKEVSRNKVFKFVIMV